MRLVLDASVAVDALVPSAHQHAVLDQLAGTDAIAPALIDTEVLSALARLERSGRITTAEAGVSLRAWSASPIERIRTEALGAQIWALRHSLRIADAHYIALARSLKLPLLTSDRRLSRAPVPGVSIVTLDHGDGRA